MTRKVCVLSLIFMFALGSLTYAAGLQKTYYEEEARAGGVSSCTTTAACFTCGTNLTTGAAACVASAANGNCSCTLITNGCNAAGTCTYRP